MAQELDLSEFEQHNTVRRGPTCTVGSLIDQLDPPDREKIAAALAATHIQTAAITRWLAARDLRVASQTLGRHRKGECACVR